jgi:soluble lytic murein transglycosylase-like protein
MTSHTIAAFVLILSLAVPARADTPAPLDEKLRLLLAHALAEEAGHGDHFDAHVWLTDMSWRLRRKMPDEQERFALLKQVYVEANRARVPPELVLAVIEVESNFDRFAISSAGAQGFMQIMPFWLKEIGRPDDNLFRTTTNLRMGCTILRYYYDMENGHWPRALARYNGSRGKNWYPNRVFTALRERWQVGR